MGRPAGERGRMWGSRASHSSSVRGRKGWGGERREGWRMGGSVAWGWKIGKFS